MKNESFLKKLCNLADNSAISDNEIIDTFNSYTETESGKIILYGDNTFDSDFFGGTVRWGKIDCVLILIYEEKSLILYNVEGSKDYLCDDLMLINTLNIDISHGKMLIFEIGPSCNLQHIHTKCPSSCTERWPTMDRELSVDIIVDSIISLYEKYNYKGWIQFAFYNEPLLYIDRMVEVMERTKHAAKFVLGTNGTLLNEDNLYILDYFFRVYITLYFEEDRERFEHIADRYPNVKILYYVKEEGFDNRLSYYKELNSEPPIDKENSYGCDTFSLGFTFDYYGNVHHCFFHFFPDEHVGNIYDDDFEDIIINYNYGRVSTRHKGDNNICYARACQICKKCDKPFSLKNSDKCHIKFWIE